MFTMDRFGRRRIFLVGIPVMIVSLAFAAMAFHFMTVSTAGKLVDNADYPKKWVGLMIGMSERRFASFQRPGSILSKHMAPACSGHLHPGLRAISRHTSLYHH